MGWVGELAGQPAWSLAAIKMLLWLCNMEPHFLDTHPCCIRSRPHVRGYGIPGRALGPESGPGATTWHYETGNSE
jgi:hypothetical protein